MATEIPLWDAYQEARGAVVSAAEILAEEEPGSWVFAEWLKTLRARIAEKTAARAAWWANIEDQDATRSRIIHEIDSRASDAAASAAMVADGGPAHEQEVT